MGEEFTLLLASQRHKTLFLLNGFIPIAEVDYSTLDIPSPRILHTHYQGTLRAIIAEERPDRNILWLVEHPAVVLTDCSEYLIKFNCLLEYIYEVLSFVESAYSQGEILVRDILRQYNSKINLIDDPSTAAPTQTSTTSTHARNCSDS